MRRHHHWALTIGVILVLVGTSIAAVGARPLRQSSRSIGTGFFDIRVLDQPQAQAIVANEKAITTGLSTQHRLKRAGMVQAAQQIWQTSPQVMLRFGSAQGALELLRNPRGTLTGPDSRNDSAAIVRDFLQQNRQLYGLSQADLNNLAYLGESVSPSGLRMVRLEQVVDGLRVFQSDTRFLLASDGRIVRSVGALAPYVRVAERQNLISASQALRAALQTAGVDLSRATTTQIEQSGQQITLAIEQSSITSAVASELMLFPIGSGVLVPAWVQLSYTAGQGDWYTVVDARSGALLWRKNIRSDALHGHSATVDGNPFFAQLPDLNHDHQFEHTAAAPAAIEPLASNQQARFSVYVQADGTTPADNPAPLSPSTATVGSGTQAAAISRTIVNMSTAQNLTASPDGWIPDGTTTTTGNNVDAYLDVADQDGPNAGLLDTNGRPIGNPDSNARNRDFLGASPRSFSYTPPPSGSNPDAGDSPTSAAFQRGVVTQLFYTTNWYHDQLYLLGFDEASGNFQLNNYGRGGTGSDRVLAEAQDGSGTDNANFSTPPDGGSGRMQMYIFTGSTPNRDGSLDAEIVIHELTHGLSNRLVGNGAGLNWDVAGGLGEGWSDFYALSLLNGTSSDDPNGSYATGGYATYQLAGLTDNYLYGIRRFPYSTNNSINPLTWADIDDVTTAYTGGIALSPVGFQFSGALEVHNVGELWALSLWEVRSRVIADPNGANGNIPTGNRTMLQLVTDALKLTPINPSIMDARDALIDADCATNSCANERWIWAGFADRGLGYSAEAPLAQVGFSGSGAHMGVSESFDLPNLDIANVTITDMLGNANGSIDQNEVITLTVTLSNPWNATTQGVASASATLSSATPQVTVVDNSASYGAIPAQGSASSTFAISISGAAACGQSIELSVAVSSSLGSATIPLTLRLGAESGTATPITYTRSNANLAIPDNDPVGVLSTLTIDDDYAIADINLRIDSLTHTYVGDVSAMLRGPSGYGVDLIYMQGGAVSGGGAGDNFINTVIDGQATGDLLSEPESSAPFTGSWKPIFNSPSWGGIGFDNVAADPVDQLSRFNGTSTAGVWSLLVADSYREDTGTLASWSLIITPKAYACTPYLSVVRARISLPVVVK